jgi:hypothetical protein
MIKRKLKVFFLLSCSLIFCVIPLSFAQSCLDNLDKSAADFLYKKIQAYFYNYYKIVKQGSHPTASQVLNEVKGIFLEGRLFNEKDKETIAEQEDFFSLTLLLNRLLRKYDLYINIFINPQTKRVCCWLSNRGEKEESSLTIWNRNISFSVITVDNLLLHGYSYYFSSKNEDIQFISFRDTIFFNREEVKKKAEERWQLLLSRYYKKSSYNAYASERLRRGLLVSAWQGIFLDSVRENNLDEAKTIFITEAVKALKKIGIYHELGHRWFDEYCQDEDDIKSEMVALLTEMRFSPLPQESLNTLLSFAWRSQWSVYRYAAQALIRDFLGFIEKGVVSNELKKRLLMIKGDSLLKRQSIFYYLNNEDVRKLAEKEFRRAFFNGEEVIYDE